MTKTAVLSIPNQTFKMDNSGTTLQNLKEKTFVYAKKAFAVAVDEKIPKTQNTLLDESMMIKLGIKPTKIMTQRFAYAGNSTRIVAEARFTAQTVLNGLPAGNTFLKVFVVRDLSLFYGVDAIAIAIVPPRMMTVSQTLMSSQRKNLLKQNLLLQSKPNLPRNKLPLKMNPNLKFP